MPLITKVVKKEIKTTEVIGASCDKCNKKSASRYCNESDLHILKIGGGYGHTYPEDSQTIQFVICSTCLRQWTDSFLHPPVDITG